MTENLHYLFRSSPLSSSLLLSPSHGEFISADEHIAGTSGDYRPGGVQAWPGPPTRSVRRVINSIIIACPAVFGSPGNPIPTMEG